MAVSDETKNLNKTETETFFRYQNFSIPNPILFSIPKFSETDTDTIKKNQKVSKPKCQTLSLMPFLYIVVGWGGRGVGGGGVSKSEFLWFSNGHILLLLHFLAVVLIVIIVGVEFIRIYSNIFIVKYIRIRIRLIFSNRIYSYSYSVFIFESNIFVFVFGFYFWTEYIRIRIRFIFRNRIVFAFSGKLKIYIHFYADEIDYTKHIFFSESYYQYISDFNDIITDDDDDFNIFERQYISRKEKDIINLDLFVWLSSSVLFLVS